MLFSYAAKREEFMIASLQNKNYMYEIGQVTKVNFIRLSDFILHANHKKDQDEAPPFQ